MSRSGDAPRGFYAVYGTIASGCPEGGDPRPAYMGIGSSFNAAFHTALDQVVGDCVPPDEAIVRRFGGERLAIPGHASRACQHLGEGGAIELMIYALAGRAADPQDPTPRAVYWATLGTRPERLEGDLRMFRTFLDRLRIGLPYEALETGN